MARKFMIEGEEYPDPDPAMTTEEVRQSFVKFFPELSNATSDTKTRGEDQVITFTKRVGTKGVEIAEAAAPAREILIRCWNKEEKRMVYKSLFDRNWYYTDGADKEDRAAHTAYECKTYQEGRHSEPMLFIWMTDDTGKRIYEGDILDWPDEDGGIHRGIMKMDDSRDEDRFLVGFTLIDNVDVTDKYTEGGELSDDGLILRIIGNVSENPDLVPAK